MGVGASGGGAGDGDGLELLGSIAVLSALAVGVVVVLLSAVLLMCSVLRWHSDHMSTSQLY